MLTTEEKRFIQENLSTDVTKLLLNPPAELKDNIRFLVDQILARRKAKDKLPTWFANPDVVMPPPLSIEQSSSELLADYKAKLVSGKLLVDLTGGMGVDCLAMCKSFEETIYVESDPHLCDRFKHNTGVFDRTIQIQNETAESFLAKAIVPDNSVFFIDPDRRSDTRKMVQFSDCTPDVTSLLIEFKKASQVLIKASPMLDIKAGINELENVAEVHVLSVKNECKEVLFLLDYVHEPIEPIIKTVNFLADGQENYEFKFSEEEAAELVLSNVSKYLLLPNASILKAGAFKTIGARFGLSKIASNTHIYTSDIPLPDFPGRQFEVIADHVSTKEIKEYLPDRMVNVITRNYPAKPDEVLKKFKLKEGGELYLIGFRDAQNLAQLVLCNKS